MLAWVNQHKIFLMEYTAPNDCVVNPDGTAYNTHRIEDFQWLEIIQLVSDYFVLFFEFDNLLTSHFVFRMRS